MHRSARAPVWDCRSSVNCSAILRRLPPRYAHLDNDPLRKASNHIANEIAAAMGEAPVSSANIADLSEAKRTKNRRG
jgi:hypothetical protein